MNSQKGFIQIPILIAIIIGVIVVGGAGYVGVKQYQNHQARQTEEKRLADNAEKSRQEKEKQAQDLIVAQQKALEETKQELEKQKNATQKTNDKVSALEKKVNTPATSQKNLAISAIDLSSYLSGVVDITCNYPDRRLLGSGTLWKIDQTDNLYVLTNNHVIGSRIGLQECLIGIKDSNDSDRGTYYLDTSNIQSWNSKTDVALLRVGELDEFSAEHMKPFNFNGKQICSTNEYLGPDGMCHYTEPMNYKISQLPRCLSKTANGSPVVTIGYPAFGQQDVQVGGTTGRDVARIVSDGIISGYDDTTNFKGLSYLNYFVSAKIDSGNSGGIALSKNESGLCVLGIPTWLTVGNYETQGVIQNIYNVLYQE